MKSIFKNISLTFYFYIRKYSNKEIAQKISINRLRLIANLVIFSEIYHFIIFVSFDRNLNTFFLFNHFASKMDTDLYENTIYNQ